MRSLFVALALLASLPSFAQQDVENARRMIASIENLLKERPNDLSRYQSEAGDRAASVAALEKVLALGNGFLPARDGFEKVWDDKAFQATRAKLEAKLPRLDYAPTAFDLEDRTFIPEGIAYDAHSHNFFVGSVAQRRIVRVGASNAVSETPRSTSASP